MQLKATPIESERRNKQTKKNPAHTVIMTRRAYNILRICMWPTIVNVHTKLQSIIDSLRIKQKFYGRKYLDCADIRSGGKMCVEARAFA